MKSLKVVGAAAVLAAVLIRPALAEEPTTAEVLAEQNKELAELKKLVEALYGKSPETLPTGDVGKLESYAGLIQTQVVPLTIAAAASVNSQASIPDSCPKTLVMSGPLSSVNVARYREVQQKIAALGRALGVASPEDLLDAQSIVPGTESFAPALDAGIISGLAGTLVKLVGLFQVDYEASSVAVTVPLDLALAQIAAVDPPRMVLLNAPRLSESKTEIASRHLVALAQARVESAEVALGKAQGTEGKKKAAAALALAKSIQTEVEAVYSALVKVDANGMAPLDYIRPYETLMPSVFGRTLSGCVLAVSSQSPAGIALTRESIFGKGGKVYAMLSITLTSVLYGSDGGVLRTTCSQAQSTAAINVGRLVKAQDSSIMWSPVETINCAILPPGATQSE